MDNQENWTLALTAASVAEAEGFTETAKAFEEIAAMEMDISSLFYGTGRPNVCGGCVPSILGLWRSDVRDRPMGEHVRESRMSL